MSKLWLNVQTEDGGEQRIKFLGDVEDRKALNESEFPELADIFMGMGYDVAHINKIIPTDEYPIGLKVFYSDDPHGLSPVSGYIERIARRREESEEGDEDGSK